MLHYYRVELAHSSLDRLWPVIYPNCFYLLGCEPSFIPTASTYLAESLGVAFIPRLLCLQATRVSPTEAESAVATVVEVFFCGRRLRQTRRRSGLVLVRRTRPCLGR